MNFRSKTALCLLLFALLLAALSLPAADPDPYEPLKLYQGSWQLKKAAPESQPDLLMNHCARTGVFFSCEQELNGKPAALVIFLPTGKSSSGGFAYRTLVALPDASKPEDWGRLEIDGDTWIYSWTHRDGEKSVLMRNVNHFKDKDHIHFELQKMVDATTWMTQMSSEEERLK